MNANTGAGVPFDQGEGRTISVNLTHSEAIVFFEWLTENETLENIPIADQAERLVLWRIEGQLEKCLSEPLAPDYKAIVAAARERVRGSTG